MTDAKNARNWFVHRKSATSGKPSEPSSSNSEDSALKSERTERSLEIVQFALDLADKALDIAEVAPFVKPAAVLLRKIIDSYKEVKTSEETRDALALRISELTGDICAAVLRMQETNHSDHVGRLKQDLEKYVIIITHASHFVEAYGDQSKLTHFLSRNEEQAKMDKLNHDLDSFGTRFGSNRLMDLCIQRSMNAQMLTKVSDIVTEKKLEEWLQSPDTRQKHRDTEELRADGTGRWLLENDTFIDWEDNSGVLWIEGPSGTGKSVLSSTVIQHLFQQRTHFTAHAPTVAFFYFDFRYKETQSIENVLRRIVLQLSAESPHPHKTLDDQYQLSKGQKLPTYLELRGVFQKLIKECGRTYIVLDALDECDPGGFKKLIELVSLMKTWTETPLHLMITSQTRDIFSGSFTGISHITLKANAMQKEDIKCFVTSALRTNPDLQAWKPCRTLVVERITEKSNGMFRLAACLLMQLAECPYGEEEELKETLETLPTDLVKVYDRFMLAIPAQYLPYAKAALRWIMFYRLRSLTLAQLADAIAFEYHEPLAVQYTYKPSRWNANVIWLSKWLAGLVQVDRKPVVLAHSSVQDYLLSDHFKKEFKSDLSEHLSHEFISRSCISYVLHFSSNPLEVEAVDKYPMVKYTAQTWYHHLSKSDNKRSLVDLGLQLLQDGSNQYRTLCHLAGESMPPLHFCCRYGYPDCVPYLLESGAGVNEVAEQGSPLTLASLSGRADVILLLLENGADVNLVGGKYDSPLIAASLRGHINIVDLLLKNGAKINLGGQVHSSALAAAAYASNTDIMDFLLENGANIDLADGKYGSALAAVCGRGNVDDIRFLLKAGADLHVTGGEYGSALAAACCSGCAPLVPLLLKHGADINSTGGIYGTALGAAAYWGNLVMFQHLLKEGANVNLMGGEYGSALGAASYRGEAHIVQLLLKHGADVNMAGGKYGCALVTACANPRRKMWPLKTVKTLLERGADIKLQGSRALKEATDKGHEDIVALLLEHGVQLDESSLDTRS
ncbi:Zinc finger, ZZ-type [Mycena sanguinolenta]|uniref:Zinc finger, ZZ-type n=1 Tax=Mycena sanguinolenta TaxID=230812 RepID=A0A8H7CW27_9AGAR|nr:Zinc finger, ZZ-type [Mycena sanguinolenta]